MKCPECNSENPDNTRFCGDCGTRLPYPEESPASPTKTLEIQKEELERENYSKAIEYFNKEG